MRSFLLVTWLVATGCAVAPVQGAKILALMVTPSRSHHIWNRSLMLALAARGHQMTVLSPDPEKSPPANFTDLVIEGAYDYSHEDFDFENLSSGNYFVQLKTAFEWGQAMCKQGIATPAVQRLMKSKEKFDLIIVEVVLEECFLGFLHTFNYPPVVGITAWSSPPWANTILGNPDNPSYISDFTQTFTDHMTFTERMANLFTTQYTKFYRQWTHMPLMDKMIKESFGSDFPSVYELEEKIEMILVNQHFGMDYVRPILPSMIPVAGMHIAECQPLPSDIQKWLDEAKDGAIFFSLGSNVRSDLLGSATHEMLLQAFSELPQRILWKFESETLKGQPANVKIGKWLPQRDILCHPNVRLFITHAGMLSTQEAVYRGVPIVGIPFMADQHINIKRAEHQGVGEKLDMTTLTKESILKVVKKVLLTPSYLRNMQRLSQLFRDQPQSSLERAVFWVEYAVRHGGVKHLRSAALDLTWYQYLLLDVIAAVLLAAFLFFMLARVALRLVCQLLCSKKKQHRKKVD